MTFNLLRSLSLPAALAATAALYPVTVAGAEQAVLPALRDAPAGRYIADKSHAYIVFSYDHQGYSKPVLSFNAFDAALELEPSDLTRSSVAVTVQTASIDSGVEAFDEHLRGADFFAVSEFPEATFKSTGFRPADDGGTLSGELTIKGITRPVDLNVTFNKAGRHFRSNVPMVGFSARGAIQRSNWDLGKYVPSVGDEVTLTIEAEFQHENASLASE